MVHRVASILSSTNGARGSLLCMGGNPLVLRGAPIASSAAASCFNKTFSALGGRSICDRGQVQGV